MIRISWAYPKGVAALLAVLSFSGCTGGGATSVAGAPSSVAGAAILPNVPALPLALSTPGAATNPVAGAVSMASPVSVQVNYRLPEAVTASSRLRQAQGSAQRGLQYIATTNTQITVVVTPLGGSGTSTGPTGCLLASCTVNFTALPGPTVLAFTLTHGANVLSTFTTTQIVQPSAQNTFNLSANPVVNSVTLQLASPSLNAGLSANIILAVQARDADNNIITGAENYVDANNHPLSILLSTEQSQAGGNGSANISGPARITAPNQAAVMLHYDGNWLDHTTISAATTQAIAGGATGATFTTIPTSYEYSTGITPGMKVFEDCLGTDGNVWFTEELATKIGRITPAGTITEFSTGITQRTGKCVAGPNGNIWFSEYGNNTGTQVAQITPNGVVTEYAAGSTPRGIVVGPDGNIWYTEQNGSSLDKMTTAGTVTKFPTSGGLMVDLVAGADGNFWYDEFATPGISRVTPMGVVTRFTAGVTGHPNSITAGPDGNIWYGGNSSNKIGKVTPNGVVTEYSTGITGQPDDVENGPDGNLWYTNGNLAKIGRITTSGVVNEYANGITPGTTPFWITQGSDGNLWFTELGGNRMGKFVY